MVALCNGSPMGPQGMSSRGQDAVPRWQVVRCIQFPKVGLSWGDTRAKTWKVATSPQMGQRTGEPRLRILREEGAQPSAHLQAKPESNHALPSGPKHTDAPSAWRPSSRSKWNKSHYKGT